MGSAPRRRNAKKSIFKLFIAYQPFVQPLNNKPTTMARLFSAKKTPPPPPAHLLLSHCDCQEQLLLLGPICRIRIADCRIPTRGSNCSSRPRDQNFSTSNFSTHDKQVLYQGPPSLHSHPYPYRNRPSNNGVPCGKFMCPFCSGLSRSLQNLMNLFTI